VGAAGTELRAIPVLSASGWLLLTAIVALLGLVGLRRARKSA